MIDDQRRAAIVAASGLTEADVRAIDAVVADRLRANDLLHRALRLERRVRDGSVTRPEDVG